MNYLINFYFFELKHKIEKYFCDSLKFSVIIIHLAILYIIIEITLFLLYYSVTAGQTGITKEVWPCIPIAAIAFITSLNSIYGFKANYTYSQKLLSILPLSNRVIFLFYFLKSNVFGWISALTLGIPEIILLSSDLWNSILFSVYLFLMVPIINAFVGAFSFLLSLLHKLTVANNLLNSALSVVINIFNYVFAIVIASIVFYTSINLLLKYLCGIFLFIFLILFMLLYHVVFDKIFLVYRYNTEYSNPTTFDKNLNNFKLLKQAKMDFLVLRRNIDYTAYALIRNYMPALLATAIILFDKNIRQICIYTLNSSHHTAILAILGLLTLINCNNYLGTTFFSRFQDALFCYKYLPVNRKSEILKRSVVMAIPGLCLSVVILIVLEVQVLHMTFSAFLIMLFLLCCSAVYGGVNSVTIGLKSSASGKTSLHNLLRNNPTLFSMAIHNLLLVSVIFIVIAQIMLTDILSISLTFIVFSLLTAFKIKILTFSVENIIDSKVI